MSLLNDKIKTEVTRTLADLASPVRLVVFTQQQDALECHFCAETRALVEQVASLSDKLSVQVYDFVADQAAVKQYKVDKIPALAIVGAQDYGIRYYGIPSGYEFGSLIQDILQVSRGESGLSAESKTQIAAINRPVHIQVFVTPTCPYCPRAVLLAHQIAIESSYVTADMVEATEFPFLAEKYGVFGVPRTVINEDIHVEGAAPEPMLIAELMKVMQG